MRGLPRARSRHEITLYRCENAPGASDYSRSRLALNVIYHQLRNLFRKLSYIAIYMYIGAYVMICNNIGGKKLFYVNANKVQKEIEILYFIDIKLYLLNLSH